MIEYATETEGWEKWMLEYRYGAFYIFPPDSVIGPVDALRHKYDPRSASYCRAHISLSQPLRGPLTEAQVQELRTALRQMPAFDIHYGPLRSFPPHPGVVYAIQTEDKFQRLRSIVHATSPFAGAPLKRKDIAPHMTIAEFITVERTEELLAELQGNVPEGTFRCDSIEYAVPNGNFYFERVLTIPIGSKESPLPSS